MAADCPHVKQLQLASDKTFLNPRSWACAECGFTDSVWACLLCNTVSCGRTNSRHALKHFEQTKHPIAVEVNLRHVHCYLCEDYVLNDNPAGDISLVQSLLAQVASQHYSESCSRSGRVIRPAQALFSRSKSRVEEAIDHAADKRYTALCHWKYAHLARAFNTWRSYVSASKQQQQEQQQQQEEATQLHQTSASTRQARKRKKPLTPGMTGLRNLGNTCYMNAVLQSLSHLILFRECFRRLSLEAPSTSCHVTTPPQSSSPTSPQSSQSGVAPHHILFTRQTTVECFQHITSRPAELLRSCARFRGGLSGGEGGRPFRTRKTSAIKSEEEEEEAVCLSAEMHALMRVLWSGKWAVVTPHAVLNAVWKLIPSFHGYTQHDAQEFLCELLLVLQNELDQWASILLESSSISPPLHPHQFLPSLFQGQLLSQVTYTGCGHKSSVQEPFWDLSLDFPEKFQSNSGPATLLELLEHFTCSEDLEGEVYQCVRCDCTKRQNACKQLLIADYPEVLRIHLKRFHWAGRTQHKINTHVDFPFQFDLRPFCDPGCVMTNESWSILYQLSSVVIHHGLGFKSGHYTAYCWNSEAESWIHCNDARLSRCSDKEVLSSQAYILFYVLLKEENKIMEESEPPEPVTKRRRMK